MEKNSIQPHPLIQYCRDKGIESDFHEDLHTAIIAGLPNITFEQINDRVFEEPNIWVMIYRVTGGDIPYLTRQAQLKKNLDEFIGDLDGINSYAFTEKGSLITIVFDFEY